MRTKLLPIFILILLTTQTLTVSAQTNTQSNSTRTEKNESIPQASQKRLINEIKKQIDALQKEANYTESIKSNLPDSQYQATISEIQANIQKLQNLINILNISILNSDNFNEVQKQFDSIRVSTHVLRALRLRRTASLLISYSKSLTNYVNLYNNFTPLLIDSPISARSNQFNDCNKTAQDLITQADQYITGIFSQIGLIYSIDANQANTLDTTLRNQLKEGKKTLDQSRSQLRTCADILKP